MNKRVESSMPFPHCTSPYDCAPAYLNDLPVGYGELLEQVSFAEISTWGSSIPERIVTGVQCKAVILTGISEHIRNIENIVSQTVLDRGYSVAFTGQRRDQNRVLSQAVNVPVFIEDWRWDICYWGCSMVIKEIKTPPPQAKLCNRCVYFVPYPFNTCNAFHPQVGVDECGDFESR